MQNGNFVVSGHIYGAMIDGSIAAFFDSKESYDAYFERIKAADKENVVNISMQTYDINMFVRTEDTPDVDLKSTYDFTQFKYVVENALGPIEGLSDDVYAHNVLATGFLEYAKHMNFMSFTPKRLREEYRNWISSNNLRGGLSDIGWEKFMLL